MGESPMYSGMREVLHQWFHNLHQSHRNGLLLPPWTHAEADALKDTMRSRSTLDKCNSSPSTDREHWERKAQ